MNFYENYASEAKQYAIFPVDRSLEYTVLGLVGEVGELISAMGAFQIESDPDLGSNAFRDAFVHRQDEEGDVWWYLAAVSDSLGVPFSVVTDIPQKPHLNLDFDEACYQLGKAVGDIAGATKKMIRDDNGVLTKKRFDIIKQGLVDIADVLMNISENHQAVMTRNLNKLESRKRRGVIFGDGDNR